MAEQSFGQLVKMHRRELYLTQDELAHRVGCASVTLRKIEYDDLRPSVQISERLAMALNIPLEARAAFIRQARLERSPLIEVTPTPMPRPEEIGQEDLSGRSIRGYALGERIGKGGMGAVYRAVQPLVEREVAIKIILPQYANHPDFIRRFESEAQLVARLEHPHIVPLYDYWREPNTAFLVMRMLRGGSLQKLIEGGALSLEMVLRIMEQIGAALSVAHRVGVIHRDLKPGNILLDEDQNAYLADFGIAKNLGNPNLEDATQADMIIGSPNYISPEQIRAEFVRPQSDIYCLGVVLYEMLTGFTPFSGPTPIDVMHQHLSADLPPLAARKPGLPASLDWVIEHATRKDPLARYTDTESLLADLRRAIQGENALPQPAQFDTAALPPLVAADNPYKGLRAFSEGDAADFFGRDALIQHLLARLGEGGDLARFLAVVGPSGSGKSSVVKAGLIPSLRRGGLPGSENWYIVDLLPGPHPFEEIEAALLRIAVNPPDSLLAQLTQDKRGLLRAVRRCLPEDRSIELVMVIDQFEELFTLVEDEAARVLLLEQLVTAVLDERSRVRIILTLRADFTDRPLQYVDFGELLRQRMEIVLPMTPDELEQAILRPAERVNLNLEPELTAAILRDVEGQPGALPLMEYALTELFDQREDHRLTKAAYDRIGGVAGALGRRAEEVYTALDGASQSAARQLFLRLVTLGEGGDNGFAAHDTRRRVPRSELDALQLSSEYQKSAIGQVIAAFGLVRLLSFDRDPITRGPTVEVAHEALLREWPRLREWIANHREDVRMQRLLAGECAEWQRSGCEVSFLLTGSRLAQFEIWATAGVVALTADERAYLEASLQARARLLEEERLRQQRELDTALRGAEVAKKLAETESRRAEEQTASARSLRRRAWALAGVLGLALLLVIATIWLAQAANASAVQANAEANTRATAESIAVGERARADEQKSTALDAQSTAEAERVRAEDAQIEAEAQKKLAEEQATLSRSRELAAASINNLTNDPQLSLLLAVESFKIADTREAQAALHQALQTSHVQKIISNTLTQERVGAIQGVAYNADGSLLATINEQDWLQVFDIPAATLRYTQKVSADSLSFRSLEFYPDGKLVVEAEYRFWVYDGATGQELLAGASRDEGVRVVDSIKGSEILSLSNNINYQYPLRLEYSPQGLYLVFYTEVERTTIAEITPWNLTTLQPAFTVQWSRDAEQHFSLNVIEISPDGRLMALPNDAGVIEIWDLASGVLLHRITDMPVGFISAIAFSADGKRIAAVGAESTIKVWELDSVNELLTVNGSAPHFLPDGDHLLLSAANQQTQVWSIAGRRLLYNFLCHPVQTVNTLHPNGRQLASGGADGSIHLCEVAPGYETQVWVSDFPVKDVDFSPMQNMLGIASVDNMVRLYDVASGDLRRAISMPPDTRLERLALFQDGSRFATLETNFYIATDPYTVYRLWNTTTGEEIAHNLDYSLPGADLQVSPDGARIFFHKYNSVGYELDGLSLKYVSNFYGDVYPLATYSPDSSLLAIPHTDGNVEVYQSPSINRVMKLTLGSMPTALMYHPSGELLTTAAADGSVAAWDTQNGEARFALPRQLSPVHALAYSPDGQWLATGSADGVVSLWDAWTGSEQGRIMQGGMAVNFLAFSADGATLLIGSDDNVVRTVLLDTNQAFQLAQKRIQRPFTPQEMSSYYITSLAPVRPEVDAVAAQETLIVPPIPPVSMMALLPAQLLPPIQTHITQENLSQLQILGQVETGFVYFVVFAPDSQTFAVGSTLGVSVLDAATLQERWRQKCPITFNSAGAFSSDGRLIAAAGDDGFVWVWNADDGSLVTRLAGHTMSPRAVDFSPDGKYLASASSDDTVRLWLTTDWSLAATLVNDPYGKGINTIHFSPDGALLAAGMQDGTLRFWAMDTFTTVKVLQAADYGLWSLDYSPDGRYVAALNLSSWNTSLWRVEDGARLFTVNGFEPSFFPDSSFFMSFTVAFAAGQEIDQLVFWKTADGVSIPAANLFDQPTIIGWKSIAFSPDGKYLALGMNHGRVILSGIP